MSAPRVLILRTAGTNCDLETEYAWQRAGADPLRLHLHELLASPTRIADFQILTLPGGFSYGDDIAAGRILATQIRRRLLDAFIEFVQQQKLVLGICNGFQVLVQTGLLPDPEPRTNTRICEITANQPAGFQARWISLQAASNTPCVFLEPGRNYELPIAHGAGRVVFASDRQARQFDADGRAALLYAPSTTPALVSAAARQTSTTRHPWPPTDLEAHTNPNGSVGNIAGLCDPSGRIFGLMPHPERFIDWVQHPAWTSLPERTPPDGLHLFQRAVDYFR